MLTGSKQILESPYSLATVIRAVLHTQYGDEVYDWDPTTVFLEVKDDFRVEMPDTVISRWSAIQAAMVNDVFFKRVDAFLGICNTLTTGRPFFDMLSPTTLEEVAWGVAEVGLNRDILPFAPGVQVYVNALLKQDGYSAPPELLEVVMDAGKKPDLVELYRSPNTDVLDSFVLGKMEDMVHQFGKIPEIDGMKVLEGAGKDKDD